MSAGDPRSDPRHEYGPLVGAFVEHAPNWAGPHVESPQPVPISEVRRVHPPGSEVQLWGGGPKARIVGVLIGVNADDVSYKVQFWNGSALATEWVDEGAIESKAPKTAIGFSKER